MGYFWIPALILLLSLIVAILGISIQYGGGKFWLGLSRLLDSNYELPEVETARIQNGLNDLFGHLTREYGPGWRLTVLRQEGIHNQVIVEKLYKQEQLPNSFSVSETVWTGDDAGNNLVEETVLEYRQKED